jgi:uncharacterized repeat protein (TIGR03803 family)
MPSGSLVQGPDGNLYGTTAEGGPKGLGTVFSCSTNGLTPIWDVNFTGNSGAFLGSYSYAGLLSDGAGNFYGTAAAGGIHGDGSIFKISSTGSPTSLGSFSGTAGTLAGEYPYAGLVMGSDGELYGTASIGGKYNDGTIFKITTGGTVSNLVSFDATNGSHPYAGLIQASDGNFYGTTYDGGTNAGSALNYGTVFRLVTGGVKPLVTFNGANGSYPSAGLIQTGDGYLYGTTENGGAAGNWGTVFQMSTNGVLTSVIPFQMTNGVGPMAGLIQASDGNLYGTTPSGGSHGGGNVFCLTPGVFIVSQPMNEIVGAGAQAVFAVTAGGGQPLSYQWFDGSNSILHATNSTLVLSSVNDSNAGTYYVVVSNFSSSVTSSPVTLTIVDAPTFVSQASLTNSTILAGGSNIYSVTIGGTAPFSYQWSFNSNAIANANSASYTVSNATSLQAGSYQVVVSNMAGAITSMVAVLTVIAPPMIVTQPQNASISPGGQATFSVNATPVASLSYQWLENSAPISGATSSNLIASDAATYTVIVSDADGSVTSSPAILSILLPPWAATEPASSVSGSTAQLNSMVTPNSSPASVWFQWGTNVNYSNQTTPISVNSGSNVVFVTTTISGLYLSQPYHFRVVVSNSVGQVAGADQMFAISSLVTAWGDDSSGQTNVPSGLSNVVALAGGGYFSLALQTSGTVAAWGDNSDGELVVPPSVTDTIAIAGGYGFALALSGRGTVTAWGDNSHGQTNVPTGLGSTIAIAAGNYHALALSSTGNVTSWGSQTSVPAGLSNVVAIAAGGEHNLALLNNGTVIAWGLNDAGETNIPAGLSNVVAIATGGYNCLALLSNGTLVAWGAGTSSNGVSQNYGQSMVGGLGNVIAIAAGDLHTVVLTTNGLVTALGYNGDGETQVPVGLSNVVSIAVGGFHSLALSTAPLPIAVTLPPSQVSNNSAVFNAMVSPNSLAATAYFQWGTTTNYGITTTPINLAAGSPPLLFSNTITGLTPLTVYHYQLVATNASGVVHGADVAFVALASPVLTNLTFSVSLGIQFQFSGVANAGYSVIVSTDLIHWAVSPGTIDPITPGTYQFTDTSASSSGQRFYEVLRGQQ